MGEKILMIGLGAIGSEVLRQLDGNNDILIRQILVRPGSIPLPHSDIDQKLDLISSIESAGLVFVGKDETGQRCEIFELKDHPYYVGVQYHPEFKSRPERPSPPFLGLLKAATGNEI